ncbi:MAG: hypothetical protein JW863_05595 [Chitinispirillaceae bacterium]|nr:hypothetical protein [Chitinispirillaceae bacterium]
MSTGSNIFSFSGKRISYFFPIISSITTLLILSTPTLLSAFNFEVFTDKSMKFKLLLQHNCIWIATCGGVIRWDMASETATEYTTTNGLSDNFCTFIGLDSAGNIWAKTNTGFDRFDDRSWHPFSDTSGLLNRPGGSRFLLPGTVDSILYTLNLVGEFPYDSIVVLASATDTFSDTVRNRSYYLPQYSHVDIAGRLWLPFRVAMSSLPEPNGYSMFDGTSWHQMPDSVYGITPIVHDINQRAVPIDSGAGRFTFRIQRIDGNIDTVDCGNWEAFRSVKDSLCLPSSMTIDTAGRLWIGAGKGLVRSDETGVEEYDFKTGPPGTIPFYLSEDRKGNIWIVGNGIGMYDGESWIDADDFLPGLPSFSIDQLVPSATDSGGMWFKSSWHTDIDLNIIGNGIAYYNGRDRDEIKVYTTNDGLTSDVITSMAMDGNNVLWCVCGGDAPSLCRFENDVWTCSPIPDSVKVDRQSLHIDRRNTIWLIPYKPARFDGTNWQVFPDTLFNSNGGCHPVYEDSRGTLWFGSCSRGLFYCDSAEGSTIEHDTTALTTIVTGIGEDSSGALWVGYGGDWTGGSYVNCKGLWRRNRDDWELINSTDGYYISSMACDRTGAMWFGCDPGVGKGVPGVSRYDGTHWQTFSVKDGFSDPRVRSIHITRNGDLWFLTHNGISYLRSEELGAGRPIARKPVRRKHVNPARVLVTPGFRSKTIGSAVYYDIRGRRVNLHRHLRNRTGACAASGIYIIKYL